MARGSGAAGKLRLILSSSNDQLLLLPDQPSLIMATTTTTATNNDNTGKSSTNCNSCAEEECFGSRKGRICILLCLALLSLLSIVLISERLISRHLLNVADLEKDEKVKIEVDIVNLLPEQSQVPPAIARESLQRLRGITLVQDAIFWSDTLEHKLDLRDMNYVEDQIIRLRLAEIEGIRDADRLHCGRGENRRVLLGPDHQGQDGFHVDNDVHACLRFGDPYAIREEVLAFHLAKQLGITNVPPIILTQLSESQQAALSPSSSSSTTSTTTTAATTATSSIKASSLASLTSWIPGLRLSPMPRLLADALATPNASVGVTSAWASERMANADAANLLKLMQFTDLILFDFLTANYDRMAAMMESAIRRRKVLRETVPNLGISQMTNRLYFIDNEAGFEAGFEKQKRFLPLQRKALNTICIFRRGTIEKLKILAGNSNPFQTFFNQALIDEPLLRHLPLPNEELEYEFELRVREILEWLQTCQQRVQQLLQ